MKGLQAKVGAKKLDVLLLSPDATYTGSWPEAEEQVAQAVKDLGIRWPVILLTDGWEEAVRIFNVHGYGLYLIGPDGKLLGARITPNQAERLILKR